MKDNIISLLTDIANWDEEYSSTWLKIRAKKLLQSLKSQGVSVVDKKQCMYCEKEILISSGLFICKECSE